MAFDVLRCNQAHECGQANVALVGELLEVQFELMRSKKLDGFLGRKLLVIEIMGRVWG
jgi:hypothetical protein